MRLVFWQQTVRASARAVYGLAACPGLNVLVALTITTRGAASLLNPVAAKHCGRIRQLCCPKGRGVRENRRYRTRLTRPFSRAEAGPYKSRREDDANRDAAFCRVYGALRGGGSRGRRLEMGQ